MQESHLAQKIPHVSDPHRKGLKIGEVDIREVSEKEPCKTVFIVL